MKTYLKTLLRMFSHHIARFVSLILMVLIAVGFVAGIGSSRDMLDKSATDYYKSQNVSDFIIKSRSEKGFTNEEIVSVKDFFGEKNVNTGNSVDAYISVFNGEKEEKQLIRLYFLDDFEKEKWSVNIPEIVEEVKAEGAYALVERSDNKLCGIAPNTKIKIDFADVLKQLAELNGTTSPDFSKYPPFVTEALKVEVTVGSTIQNPLYFALDAEPSYLNGEDAEIPTTTKGAEDLNLITLDNILYMPSSVIPEIMGTKVLPTGDIYAAADDRTKFEAFGKDYKQFTNDCSAVIESKLADGNSARIITLYQNFSFMSLHSYAQKVMGIGVVLMVVFLFVTVLVVLSNMTRLIEEERAQVACLRTLGYSAFKIIFKYLLFAAIATGIGGAGSYFIGLGLAYFICYVFNYSFAMPPISAQVTLIFFVITFAVVVIATLVATAVCGLKLTGDACANLLRPKPPKAGKKVFLERIPIIWNRLSFKYKSTMRNVLRYMNRFLMTVISVAVSMALMIAGFAVLDLSLFGGMNSPSLTSISVVIVLFAGLLTTVVIYTLTNINVSERNRELATLQVMGYYDKEISGYVYREVYIDTIVGIIFGYPLAIPILLVLFDIVEMGTIVGMSWFWWFVAPAVVLLFTFIVTVILRKRIVGIDMNESLKAIE